MTRTLHHGTGALVAVLITLLLLIGAAPAHASLDTRDDHALGRYADTTSWGDFSTPLTQSLAILALHRADDTAPSAAAVDLLLAQQCADGSFPDAFRAPSTGDPAACTGGVDATAIVVTALDAVGETDAVAEAAAWLTTTQDADGAFGGQDGRNTNSTGLAALALELGGYPNEAQDARDWVVALQDGCDADTPGAIPFNDEDRGAAELSTGQALLGLADPTIGLGDLDASTVVGSPDPACGPEDELTSPVEAAASFLTGLLVDDPFVPFPGSDFANVGGTIDVLFGLTAAGTGETAIADIVAWLPGQAAGYTQDGEDGAAAGATAKLALALLVANADPRSATDIDLIAQLEALEVTETGEVTVACGDGTAAPGDEVACTISGLLAFETIEVRLGDDPEPAAQISADGDGEATAPLTIPDEGATEGSVTVTVDGQGAADLATVTLSLAAAEEPEELDGPDGSGEPDETDASTDEDPAADDTTDEDVLPETGGGTALLAALGALAVLLGGTALVFGRRTHSGPTSR